MLFQSAARGSAHVVVLGNEKGGTGKSTTAMHLIVALLKAGFRVASVDTDSRQRSLTRYIENRARWSRQRNLGLDMPVHFVARLAAGETVKEIEAQEFATYADIVDRVQDDFDYVVVDTPANDSYLMRLSHAMADTLITPVNDSFIDLDILGQVNPDDFSISRRSHYAELVDTARAQRRGIDGVEMDWIVIRNRIATLPSRNQRNLLAALRKISPTFGFRLGDGISERVVFREYFPLGLTALDTLDQRTHGATPTMSHMAARNEIRELAAFVNLPRTDSPIAPERLAAQTADGIGRLELVLE